MADEVSLDLTGENVHPETVDARASLGLAMALLEALVAVGAYEDSADEAPFFLALTEMRPASVHLAFQPVATQPDRQGARAHVSFEYVAKRLPVYLRGHEALPKELVKPVEKLRLAARAMPANMNASARIVDETISLSQLAEQQVELITSAETFRAYIERAGGKRPRVALRVPGQIRTFTANISKHLLASDEFHLYREAEVSGVFKRDPHEIGSPIVSGEVTHVSFLETVDRVAAFDKWYEATGRPWQDVQDIEEELRRRGSH